jgi:MerR family transcriptional regulator/heat shock protein HspR
MAEHYEQRVFMISVAAAEVGMHPQTLRIYEARGLIRPQRSAKNTRLYNARDIAMLRRIQQLTALGINLFGVEEILRLERQLEQARRRIDELEHRQQ